MIRLYLHSPVNPPKDKKMNNNEKQNKFQPVTRELVGGMLAAIQRINAIHASPLKKVTDDAELESATTYLAQNFLQHAGEFLGTWITVANEYEPLVSAWATFNARTAGYSAVRQKQQNAAIGSTAGDVPTAGETEDKIIIPNFVKTKETSGPRDQTPTS
jgi:hypothetical protein